MKVLKKIATTLASLALVSSAVIFAGCDNVVNTGDIYTYDEWCKDGGVYTYTYDDWTETWNDRGVYQNSFSSMDTYSAVLCDVKKSIVSEDTTLLGITLIIETEENEDMNFALVFREGKNEKRGHVLYQKSVSTTANTQTVVTFAFDEPITNFLKKSSDGEYRVFLENRTYIEYADGDALPEGVKKAETNTKKYYYDDSAYAGIKWKIDEFNFVVEEN